MTSKHSKHSKRTIVNDLNFWDSYMESHSEDTDREAAIRDPYTFAGIAPAAPQSVPQLVVKYEMPDQKIGFMWAALTDLARELDSDLNGKSEIIYDYELYRIVNTVADRLKTNIDTCESVAGRSKELKQWTDLHKKMRTHLAVRFRAGMPAQQGIPGMSSMPIVRKAPGTSGEPFIGTYKEMVNDVRESIDLPNRKAHTVRTAFRLVERSSMLDDFLKNLCDENMWSVSHSCRVIEEYKRFIALAIACPSAVHPSDAVEQVWRMHMFDTKSYEEFVRKIGKTLPHNASKGVHEVKDQYGYTLAEYEKEWGIPPANVWPPVDDRFKMKFIRICSDDHVVIHRPSFRKTSALVSWTMDNPVYAQIALAVTTAALIAFWIAVK
jgi:hypothetical protein